MKTIFVHRIGLMAPGMPSWSEAIPVLKGEQHYDIQSELPKLNPVMLKAAVRRRASQTIRLAVQAAGNALGDNLSNNQYPSVFTSSEGDMTIVDHICRALNEPERPVSPTHFHNSVHNAPSGYYSIASGSNAPSTSLAGVDGSFSAGLIEACTQASLTESPVLLVSYDHAVPYPLSEPIPIKYSFACAILLSASANDSGTPLSLNINQTASISALSDPGLEALRLNNPSARALPLLQILANGSTGLMALPYMPGRQLEVTIGNAG